MQEIILQNETVLFKNMKETDDSDTVLLNNEEYKHIVDRLISKVESVESPERVSNTKVASVTNKETQENQTINTLKSLRQRPNSHALFKILERVEVSERNKIPKSTDDDTKVEPPKRKLVTKSSFDSGVLNTDT